MSNIINQYNSKNQKHGYWMNYYHNNNIWYKGNFFNGITIGYWEVYHDNIENFLSHKIYYII